MNALEKILARNSTPEVFSSPEIPTTLAEPPAGPAADCGDLRQTAASLPDLAPCPTCLGQIFWESIYRDSVYRCEICSPPPSPRFVGRRLSCGLAPNPLAEPAPPGGPGGPSPSPDSLEALAARLASNLASDNCTGNPWADARRRGRLAELVEVTDVKSKRLAATGYPRYVNQRFTVSNPPK